MSEDKDKIQAILDGNKEKEFVRRIEALKDAETDDSNSLDMGGGYRGTHMMAAEVDEEGNWYVFPTIVNIDGRLQQLDPNEAFHHAKTTGEYIAFGKEKDAAISFSKNYKKVWEKPNE